MKIAPNSGRKHTTRPFLAAMAALGTFALVAPLAAQNAPGGIDALREWNLVVFNNLDSNSEVEGRTFVGGDLNGSSSNYNIGNASASTRGQPGLTVVGNVNGNHKNLNNGSGAIVGGNVNSGFNLNGPKQTVQVGGTISNTNVNQNTVNSGLAASDPQFLVNLKQDASYIQSSLNNLSYDLGQMEATSRVIRQGSRARFSAQAGEDGTAVFNLTSSDLDSFREIAFDKNGAETVIVNVTGKNIVLDDNFLGNSSKLGESVIWNFPDAETLTVTTAWRGSILAPKAKATTSNFIEGSAVFSSLTQRGEFHMGTFNSGFTPPNPGGSSSGGSSSSSGGGTNVPEPSAFLLFLLAAAAVLFRRRRSAKI